MWALVLVLARRGLLWRSSVVVLLHMVGFS